jgi:LysM repeat protein
VEVAPDPLRLSRRGRVVRTAVVAAVAVALGWTVLSTVAAGAAPPVHTVTVESGQTLSSIAARELPGLPVRDGVAQIQLANGLNSSDVHVGQVLQIPARG